MDPLGRTIPVDFEIPPDAYVTDHDNASDQVLWLLHAKADVPGIDYADDFELPVFRTSSAAELSSAASSSETPGFSSESSSVTDSAPVAAPAHTKVVISSQAGGTEFYFPAFRTPSRALFLLVFTAIWSGVVYFLFHSSAPWFFGLVFGFFDLLMILICFHVVLGTSRIRVGNGEIISTTRILGIGSAKRFAISEIDAIVPVTSGQQGGNGGESMYAIRLRTKNGRRITLADEIASRQEARWIVSQIEISRRIENRHARGSGFALRPAATARPNRSRLGRARPATLWFFADRILAHRGRKRPRRDHRRLFPLPCSDLMVARHVCLARMAVLDSEISGKRFPHK